MPFGSLQDHQDIETKYPLQLHVHVGTLIVLHWYAEDCFAIHASS